MTDRNGNLNENSRSGSREDGREPVRRNTAMNSREIMLEDEDYLVSRMRAIWMMIISTGIWKNGS